MEKAAGGRGRGEERVTGSLLGSASCASPRTYTGRAEGGWRPGRAQERDPGWRDPWGQQQAGSLHRQAGCNPPHVKGQRQDKWPRTTPWALRCLESGQGVDTGTRCCSQGMRGCCGWNCVPQNPHAGALTPRVTLFGDSVFRRS